MSVQHTQQTIHNVISMRLRIPGRRHRDLVIKGGGHYDLMVATTKPKHGWDDNRLLVVEFEGQFYEVIRREKGAPPQDVVYFLRTAPNWKSTAHPYRYDPEADEPEEPNPVARAVGVFIAFIAGFVVSLFPRIFRPRMNEDDSAVFLRATAAS